MAKKMYVIQAEDGMFFCGMRYWDKQLRKAKIYHSLHYAKDVVDAYEECNCKIVKVSLAIVPEAKTNADRIRAMSDEELAEWIARTQIRAIKDTMTILRLPYAEGDEIVEIGKTEALEWLKQPAEVNENG